MRLDYATLISPYPLHLQGVGHIKSPTLKEIWNPQVTYPVYNVYLAVLLMTPQTYLEQINPHGSERYQAALSGLENSLSMIDIISGDKPLQEQYCTIFNFFFEESVIWDDENCVFFTHTGVDESGKISPVGIIHKDIFDGVCDIILQRCGVNRKETDMDTAKVKSRRAMEILQKIRNHKKQLNNNPSHDKDMELPNLIASVAVKSNSINYTNIWDLTVFQLYEHFRKEQNNVYFNLQQMSVAAWGNEKKTFIGNEWYKNDN